MSLLLNLSNKYLLAAEFLLYTFTASAQELVPVRHKNEKGDDKYENSDKRTIKPKYGSVRPFYYGLATVSIDHGYYKNKYGKRIVEKPGCGYINKNGNIVIPMEFNYAEDFKVTIGVENSRHNGRVIGHSEYLIYQTAHLNIQALTLKGHWEVSYYDHQGAFIDQKKCCYETYKY